LAIPSPTYYFEDTRRAVLYQNNKPKSSTPTSPNRTTLTEVLGRFFHYAEPDIATFEHAVQDFQGSIRPGAGPDGSHHRGTRP
jgi:hypothetical protein